MTVKKYSLGTAFLMLGLLSMQHAIAAGDAKKGADVFAEECGDCHSVTPGKNKKGPSLAGVIGRKAGSVADFSGYSDSMKQSGIVWAAERIDAYITHPKKVVPAGKMKYDGLDDAAARADVIAYLSSVK
ncbi:MAG: c-type cytochrome [Bacteroidota bacterium]